MLTNTLVLQLSLTADTQVTEQKDSSWDGSDVIFGGARCRSAGCNW
jgi:hypothetical protein